MYIASVIGKDYPFIQYCIRKDISGKKILTFGLPRLPWSQNLSKVLEEQKNNLGVDFRERNKGESTAVELFEIDFGAEELEKAYSVLELCIQTLGFDRPNKVALSIEGQMSVEAVQNLNQKVREELENTLRDPSSRWFNRLIAKSLLFFYGRA